MCLLGSNGAGSDGHGAAPWALTGRRHGRVSRTREEKKGITEKGVKEDTRVQRPHVRVVVYLLVPLNK